MKKLQKLSVLFSTALVLGSSVNSASIAEAADYNLPDARFEVDPLTPSWEKDKEHPAKLRWYVNFDWYAQHWGQDIVSKKIMEDMNVEVEFISGNDENLNTMMAGGDLPDIITFDKNINHANDADKFAIPLNLLAEKYDPYFLESAAKKETLAWYTHEDGNIYGYPSFSTTKQDYEDGNVVGDQVFIVRKDIYEAIGSPDMSTPEGFLQALRDAQEKFPETDEGAPIVPFAGTALDIANGGDGAFGGILQDFLNIPVTVDGKWNDRDVNEDYINWIDTFRQAYSEGLMSPDQFSDNDNTMKEKMTQGTYFAYLHTNTKGLNEFMSDNNARNAEQTYIAIDGPKNAKGEDHTFNGGNIGGWTATYITRSTKEPQKAMELLTYLASEYGTMVSVFGVEGKTYEMKDGQAVYTDFTNDLRNTDIAKFDKEIALGNYWFVSNDNYAISMGQKPSVTIREMVEWAQDKVAPRFEIEDIEPKEGALNRSLVNLNTARVQALVAFIQSPDSETGKQVWQEYLDSRDGYGFQEIVEHRNAKIAENIAKLGE